MKRASPDTKSGEVITIHFIVEICSDWSVGAAETAAPNRRCPHAPDGYSGSISCSCHSLEEVAKKKPTSDYVFLSPIFNSISKAGYEAAFSTAALHKAAAESLIDNKVYALGGVSKEHIAQLKELSFGGAAFLGDVWRRMYDPTVDIYLDELRNLLS